MKRECITIYTDASVCLETGCGGWACWVKHAGRSFIESGPFRELVICSTEAELRAIANAVHVVVKRVTATNVLFVVVTDSHNAIETFAGRFASTRRLKNPERYRVHYAIAAKVRAMLPAGCELKVNKVKAHSHSDGARSYVNDLVDRAARAAMRARRQLELMHEDAS